MAINQFSKRDGIQINPLATDLIPVEIFTNEQMGKTIQKIHETGIIQVDTFEKKIRFEGKKTRWSIPAFSIYSLELEEVQTGTPGQSATGMLNYYVVIRFKSENNMEFGFRNAARDFGEFDDDSRAKGGTQLYEAFNSILLIS